MSLRAQCFPKSLRLITAKDYQQVFKSSHQHSNKFFLLLVRENQKSSARLGLAISKKNVPSASERNYLKRIIRENFRRSQKKLQGKDIVVLARNETTQYKNKKQLWVSLNALMQKIL
ncbi:MAG: ribonuclease P protein component [Gammaproteobacteria bacterium]|nr:ribonuclease P protein component [Gammaproteobacteria bacterium]